MSVDYRNSGKGEESENGTKRNENKFMNNFVYIHFSMNLKVSRVYHLPFVILNPIKMENIQQTRLIILLFSFAGIPL